MYMCLFSMFFRMLLFHKMAFGKMLLFHKPLSTCSISMVISLLVFISFVHSSCTRLQGGVAEDAATSTATQGLESHVVKSLGKGASTIVAENSAREVPTGPDPLHHNNNPTRP